MIHSDPSVGKSSVRMENKSSFSQSRNISEKSCFFFDSNCCTPDTQTQAIIRCKIYLTYPGITKENGQRGVYPWGFRNLEG